LRIAEEELVENGRHESGESGLRRADLTKNAGLRSQAKGKNYVQCCEQEDEDVSGKEDDRCRGCGMFVGFIKTVKIQR
jgi:hypothetical protein